MSVKVCKFGGSSLAQASQIRKVAAIIADDEQRRIVVPSAPGKRDSHDQKVTDLLYLCHEHARQELPFTEIFGRIRDRYVSIIDELELDLDLRDTLNHIEQEIRNYALQQRGPDYAASRGEFLNAQIIAAFLGFSFIDAAELIFFDSRGKLDAEKTYRTIADRLADMHHGYVIPGFYGCMPDQTVRTFSRGGSDITGSIMARGVHAAVYENWTDVSGVLMTDPRIVDNPPTIDVITYRELRELAYMGATVLHDEAVFPVREAGIPVNIRNTNEPDHPGTMIVPTSDQLVTVAGTISGIAGRKDLTVIAIEKAMMNSEIGFGRKVLGILERHGVSFEHMPSGIDTLSIVVEDRAVEGKMQEIVEELKQECQPDSIEVYPDMAAIATVGRGMAKTPGMAAKLFHALAEADINIRMIDQGSSELNIIVGIEAADFERTVRTIYQAFR